MQTLADELNAILLRKAPQIYEMLSPEGENAYFPKKGIVGQSAEAKGVKINATVGQATEDDGSPMGLETIVVNTSLPKEKVLPYSPSYGQKELRDLWAAEIKVKNPSLNGNLSLPVVTSGLTHGISIARKLFVSSGGEIILPDRSWENYSLIFKDAKIETFPLFSGKEFNAKGFYDSLENSKGKHISLMLNFPNNPTGYTPTENEAELIAAIIKNVAERGKSITAICDDAYFGLVYEPGIMRESIFSKLADLDERVLAIKIDGATKEMYTWGLRAAFVTYGFKGMDKEGASVLEDKTAGAVRETVSNSPTQSQYLLIEALKSPKTKQQLEEKFKILEERYHAVKEALASNPHYSEQFNAFPFNSGYFLCVEINGKSAEQVDEIRQRLRKEYSTGVISLGNTLRITHSSVKKELIPELFENVYKACKAQK